MDPIIVCGPDPKCFDPHRHRWHCMRGHAEEVGGPALPGYCPLTKCRDRRGANRTEPTEEAGE